MPKLDSIFQPYELRRELARWEIKRTERLLLEEQFKDISAWFDVVELHIPYTKFRMLKIAMQETKKRKDKKKILVINGDSLNLDMFSKFYRRSSADSTPSEEFGMLLRVMEDAHKVYDHILYLTTNHENRFEKIVIDSIGDKTVAKELLKFMNSFKDIFEEAGYNKVVYVSNYLFQIGDVIVCHFENNSIAAGKVGRDIVQYLTPRLNKEWNVAYQSHCFDEKTEILTKRGWMYNDALKVEDEVLSYSIEKDKLEWNYIKEKVEYSNYKELIHIKNKIVDLMVTPEHTIIRRDYSSKGKIIKSQAKELLELSDKSYWTIPVSSRYKKEDLDIEDDLLRLYGWYITEGTNYVANCRHKKKRGIYLHKQEHVMITQTDKHNYHTEIEKILKRLKIKYRIIVDNKLTKGGYKAYRYFIDKVQIKKVLKYCLKGDKLKKDIPMEFKELSKKQFDIFLKVLVKGDGTIYSSKCFQFTGSKYNCDLVQELCMKNGYTATNTCRGTYHVLSIYRRKFSAVRKKKVVKYKGKVWCVSVNNGTVVVRRNGKMCITGNTHSQSKIAIDRKVVIETGGMLDSLDYWRNGKMKGRGKMSTIGYGKGRLKNGKAILNDCDFHICAWEGYL